MSAAVPRLPDSLRRSVAEDLRPVRPLPPPWRRALALAVWVPAAVAAVLTLLHLRQDAPALGPALTWLPLFFAGIVGIGLMALSLGEAIPGRASPTSRGIVLGSAGLVTLVVAAVLTAARSPGMVVPNPAFTKGPACFAMETFVGLSALGVALVLIRRAAPLRALRATLLAGVGAGVMAEGVYRLHCSISDLRHVLPWHGGAVVLLTLAGLAAGLVLEAAVARRLHPERGRP